MLTICMKMDVRKQALSLIKKDLLSQKWMTKYQNKGFDVEVFDLNLSGNIFDIMEIKRPIRENDLQLYKKLVKIANDYSVNDHDRFHYLTKEIYEYLLTLPKQPKQQKHK